ncbi:MAG: endonuclease/exonuclease/phosphatase family protein [Chlorogloeopsis fritschii C42_A2020_084]|uniref:endonuclease/exonuclease/phosphatase family protein n=1 Tax=Chlorogloeopsis fritschii TaxID=1124 RepID=UPI0019E01182|nr:endonuclease/exonuclease/phosphatase family protein [Chlorogloeopsis fritschii]MBF2005424.1 endonuclease/exonuclease/phosphatase family protein [Chlorogloeopsis fritschii C42_A2020_084]
MSLWLAQFLLPSDLREERQNPLLPNAMIKVATINILYEMKFWQQRRELLVEGLAAVGADLIGLQETNLQANTGFWLAEQLDMPYVHLVAAQERSYVLGTEYGTAILSRHPFIQKAELDLQSQGRIAQYVQVKIGDRSLVFCNGHYYCQPGSSSLRIRQIQSLINWLSALPPDLPVVVVGDFNATPETPEIAFMREQFTSAYAAQHGCEPEYTCPTPLLQAHSKFWRPLGLRLINLWTNRTFTPWRGTLDYIFVNKHLSVCDCQLILTEPAPDRKNIYPSDHFGIAAELEIVQV